MPLFFDVLFLYFVKSAQKTEKDELVSREGGGRGGFFSTQNTQT